jgi:L-aspartate oxidase
MHNPILIIGGGLAGLFCALKLAPQPVTILSTAPIGEGASSVWAQGGIAAALADGDTPGKHTADTLIAGAGISDEAMVAGMAHEAPARIHDLLAYGVPFDRDLASRLVQSREAAHSERRIVRVKGDTAGKAIIQALHVAAKAAPSIQVISGVTAQELVLENGRVTGVIVDDAVGTRWRYEASAIVLATGGIGQLYAVTTNPLESCGLGLAIAARAGALIADAEFVQFHPTAIDIGKDPAPLATEALRGDGAILVNGSGSRFMLPIHKDAELAPRDIVARAVFAEVAAGRGAFLDAREKIGVEFPAKYPTVYASCVAAGIDPVKDLIPVIPAEHYHMGGIASDARGRTSLAGLWAAGEVACTGVHGANRLASNSLLEAVVFASRIGEDIGAMKIQMRRICAMRLGGIPPPGEGGLREELRKIMSSRVGVIRNGDGLKAAIAAIWQISQDSQSAAQQNMCVAAQLIATSAWLRHESRGGHYRDDYPRADVGLATRSHITLAQSNAIVSKALAP